MGFSVSLQLINIYIRGDVKNLQYSASNRIDHTIQLNNAWAVYLPG